MLDILIKNVEIVNEGKRTHSDIGIKNGRIKSINSSIDQEARKIIEGERLVLIPGMIDDQVHFREPGLTHKAEIYTESRAAAAGGITSFMEMPNTNPQTTTLEKLEEKFQIAAEKSLVNYSFFFGATNDNIEEVKKLNPAQACGIKIFMGSSTGNMLVDDHRALESVFHEAGTIIATHCEKEEVIRENTRIYKEKYGEDMPITAHPLIRSREACLLSSTEAVELAKETGADLHILHISTENEIALFSDEEDITKKKITAEACVHHLWFSDEDYEKKGSLIKWNPAVKTEADRDAVRKAVRQNRIDILATDHAPHTLEEKQNKYLQAPSGGPLVQHAVPAYMEMVKEGVFSIEEVVQKTSHNVAERFKIKERGYIREGYWADLVLIDPNDPWTVNSSNLLYKCKWSPFEGIQFSSKIMATIASGNLVYEKGDILEKGGLRLEINR